MLFGLVMLKHSCQTVRHWSGLAALVKRMGLPAVTVAIDGSVYERHPKFHGYMMEILGNSRFSSNTQVGHWQLRH